MAFADPAIQEINVYGVAVPGCEGRCGMAMLVLTVSAAQFNFAALYQHIYTQLPSYARPIFLRISREIEVTGTFKHRKVDLVQAG